MKFISHTCPHCFGGRPISRRRFVASALAVVATVRAHGAERTPLAVGASSQDANLPVIDIHVHCTHRGRPDEQILDHQRNTRVKTTVILPAGETAGLSAGVAGNAHVVAFARKHPGRFFYFANENVFRPNAAREIERYLKDGAIGIGELKDNVACDSADMLRIAEVAREYNVPMLIDFQDGDYNDGFSRFHRVLEQFPTVKFIAHAQTFWAHVDKNYKAENGSYPTGPITPGGLADRWLADYPNFYGDLSAGSGNNALTRDNEFSRGFLKRHQKKLLYGSDCRCATGVGPTCLAATKLGLLRQLSPTREILRKILFENAQKLYRLPKDNSTG